MALPPVILLHAFPVDARLWEDVEQQLREQGIEPIVPNLRGFGTNRDELPTEPNLDALADDVAALIEGTGAQSAVVAGVSMGGYVAMNLARRYPERVAGLVLVDTKAAADPQAGADGRRAFADRVDAEGSAWVADAMMSKLISDSTVTQRPDVEQRVRQQIAGCPPATIAWIQRAMAQRPDSFDVLDTFDGPVLVIVGSEDLLSPPADAVAMAEASRQATLIEIPGVGHLTPLENPVVVTVAISEWLADEFGSESPA